MVGVVPVTERHLGHVGHEPVAAAVRGADDLLGPPVVAHGLACLLDPGGQRRLGHEPVAPHGVEQVLLGHDPVAVGHEVDEDIEDLGLDLDPAPAGAQLVGAGVELDTGEPEAHGR